MFERTSNPAFKKAFSNGFSYTNTETMTLNGTINKSFILLLATVVTASLTWRAAFIDGVFTATPLVIGLLFTGMIVGLIAALVTSFKMEWAKVTAPIYAIAEGLFIGGISAFFEARFPGLVVKAVALTFGVFFLMLFAYRTRIIKPTKKLMMGIVIATAAIAVFYLVQMILGMFGIVLPTSENGTIGIVFSVVVVAVAALNLILDFNLVEEGVERGAPKYMEWYASFALLVTLVWLYIEILTLLAKIQGRD